MFINYVGGSEGGKRIREVILRFLKACGGRLQEKYKLKNGGRN